MKENKENIVARLSLLLKATRAGADIDRLELSEDGNEVKIIFLTGCEKPVNVECDSGIALIQDVVSRLL